MMTWIGSGIELHIRDQKSTAEVMMKACSGQRLAEKQQKALGTRIKELLVVIYLVQLQCTLKQLYCICIYEYNGFYIGVFGIKNIASLSDLK